MEGTACRLGTLYYGIYHAEYHGSTEPSARDTTEFPVEDVKV
jgi:hypothetical protein